MHCATGCFSQLTHLPRRALVRLHFYRFAAFWAFAEVPRDNHITFMMVMKICMQVRGLRQVEIEPGNLALELLGLGAVW